MNLTVTGDDEFVWVNDGKTIRRAASVDLLNVSRKYISTQY